MAESRLEYLFSCYVNNHFTKQEEEELMALLAQPGNQLVVQKLIDTVIENTAVETQMTDEATLNLLQKILHEDKIGLRSGKPKRTFFGKWWRLVAALIIFLVDGSFELLNGNNDARSTLLMLTKIRPHILPLKNRALLPAGNLNENIGKNSNYQMGCRDKNKRSDLIKTKTLKTNLRYAYHETAHTNYQFVWRVAAYGQFNCSRIKIT